MAQNALQQNDGLLVQGGLRELHWPESAMDDSAQWDRFNPMPIGPAAGPQLFTEKLVQRIDWQRVVPRVDPDARVAQSMVTIEDFVEHVFVPEHVAMKKLAGRIHYQAILKHVLTPEKVDRVFQADLGAPNRKLKTLPNWPYLNNVRLCEARSSDVQRLISAALAHGYSTQTVNHIRSVISAIFTHAKKKHWFSGDNPAGQVKPVGMVRKEARALTLDQAKQVLGVMQYPEKELALIAMLTGMKVAEICGLQWKHVNLSDTWSGTDSEPIPPRTIAVRRQWFGKELVDLKWKSRARNLPIPEVLLPILLELSRRPKFNGPDDLVLVSRAGMAVNANNLAARRLKSIGRDLQMPGLSWNVFYRTRKNLLCEVGMQFHEMIMRPSDSTVLVSEPVEHTGSSAVTGTDSVWMQLWSWASSVVRKP